MTPDTPSPAPPPADPAPPMHPTAPLTPLILAVILLGIIGIELVLQAADRGWIGTLRWRTLAYQYGAFWPGLLDNWTPNYTGQPGLMFVSYAFMHGGMSHLLGNAITLWVLGGLVCDRAGQHGFAAVYALTALGGALCYAALSNGVQPMVGASGAIFGLAGIWTGWRWLDNPPGWPNATFVLGVWAALVGLNMALWWWHDGHLAWQTHLGGYVTGFALAGWLGRTPTRLTTSK